MFQNSWVNSNWKGCCFLEPNHSINMSAYYVDILGWAQGSSKKEYCCPWGYRLLESTRERCLSQTGSERVILNSPSKDGQWLLGGEWEDGNCSTEQRVRNSRGMSNSKCKRLGHAVFGELLSKQLGDEDGKLRRSLTVHTMYGYILLQLLIDWFYHTEIFSFITNINSKHFLICAWHYAQLLHILIFLLWGE